MNPQIDFKHVLGELSVNRNDPCEVVRELISNSYDALADSIRFAGLNSSRGFVFWDNGTGLNRKDKKNGITPYEAFFSIGKSTKTKGEAIGYKCQGSKLCFASNRVLVISKTSADANWFWKIIENPRQTLNTAINITPEDTMKPWEVLAQFCGSTSADAVQVATLFDEKFFRANEKQGTLVAVQGIDVENFSRHLLGSAPILDSYLGNYVRFCTRHGDTRRISESQGFRNTHTKQVGTGVSECRLEIFDGTKFEKVPFGFPYLNATVETDVKSPLEVARLRDGRFSARYAKCFKFANNLYSLILAIDGNRRAHDGYGMLDRKGATKSGLRLADQRGVAISVNGIKICRYNEIFYRTELADYQILADTDSAPHYLLIIDGPFDLVTNRNSLSKSSVGVFEESGFLMEIKRFLDDARKNLAIFDQLVGRLNREQREAKLSQQIDILAYSKASVSTRERFRIGSEQELFVSPLPGEEYLVGVLYATLGDRVEQDSKYKEYWKKVFTFSTQGIDSIGSEAGDSLDQNRLVAIEYKYEFSNKGPFNHALCLVNLIVAWTINLADGETVWDDYDCFGSITQVEDGIFHISDIEDKGGSSYPKHVVTVVSLKALIQKSFSKVAFRSPPAKTAGR